MFSQGSGIRLGRLRGPHQRTGMRAQREQIGPEFIVQLAGDLLALGILQRDGALGELALFLDGLAQRRRQMVQLAADRGQFGRTAGLDPRVIAAGFDVRHRLRKRLNAAPARG